MAGAVLREPGVQISQSQATPTGINRHRHTKAEQTLPNKQATNLCFQLAETRRADMDGLVEELVV